MHRPALLRRDVVSEVGCTRLIGARATESCAAAVIRFISARPSQSTGQPFQSRNRPSTMTAMIWSRLPNRTSSQVRSQDGVNSGVSISTSRQSAASPTAIRPVMAPSPMASAPAPVA